MHDDTLDRTNNGRGPVNRLTLAELRELDAGSWFGPQFAGERIPTLQEILQFARETDVVFYLEIKSSSGAWGMEHTVVGALREAQEVVRPVVLSFDHDTLAAVRRIEPTLMTGFLFQWPLEDAVDLAIRAGARQLAPHGDQVTPELITAARHNNLQVVTWTINAPAQMREIGRASCRKSVDLGGRRIIKKKKKDKITNGQENERTLSSVNTKATAL